MTDNLDRKKGWVVKDCGGDLDGLIHQNCTMHFCENKEHQYTCKVKTKDGKVHQDKAWKTFATNQVRETGEGENRRIVCTAVMEHGHKLAVALVSSRHGLDVVVSCFCNVAKNSPDDFVNHVSGYWHA